MAPPTFERWAQNAGVPPPWFLWSYVEDVADARVDWNQVGVGVIDLIDGVSEVSDDVARGNVLPFTRTNIKPEPKSVYKALNNVLGYRSRSRSSERDREIRSEDYISPPKRDHTLVESLCLCLRLYSVSWPARMPAI
jgi:hypothetical protein